jgi:hypothetical protein
MAGKRSKQRKGGSGHGKKRSGGVAQPTSVPRNPPPRREEEEYSGTMMGMRSGFKRMANTDGEKKKNSLWNWLSWIALGAALLFLFQKYGC